jgi:hypothetical protein
LLILLSRAFSLLVLSFLLFPATSCTRKPEQSSFVSRVLEEAKSAFREHPDRYVPTITRGAGGSLQEAVVRLKDGQLEVAPAFQSMKKGSYLLRIRSAKDETAPISGAALEQVRFEWDPQNPAPVAVSELQPRVYVLSLLRTQSEDHEPTGDQSWVLVTGAADFEKASTSFQQAKQIVSRWPEVVQQGEARGFLRAYLDLASSAVAK